MAQSRLIGSYPVIGIRPTIDGRRGPLKVRESLEVQTMNMAKNAAKLIQENVFYSNGEPVKVVIADTTIGRVAEAAACADKFKKEGVDITLTVTPCWCYGSETMDMDPMTIKAVWGFNGTERPGAVYLAAVLAGHAQKGLPAFGIYGHDVQDLDDTSIPADVSEKILRFARAAVADTPAMVLDEATSSIDTRTEALVQDGLDKLMHGRTVFVIAHRLSTVRNSNAIMVLDHGHIIERGTHEQLIDMKGTYYQLYTGAFELE